MNTQKLTMSQALVKWMAAQSIRQLDGTTAPAFAAVWGIFGHGNVAGLGEALYQVKDEMPTYRGHNEQTMAHAAIAFAKQKQRRQMMAVTSSIGPGQPIWSRPLPLPMSTACPCYSCQVMSLQIDAQTQYCSRLSISLMQRSLLMIALELFHAFLTA